MTYTTQKQVRASTPLPWQDGPVFNTDGRAVFYNDTSKPGKWQRRVDNKTGIFTPEDAAFIVQACNSHDALVAALRQYLDADTFNRNESALHDARIAAQAALRAIE